MHVKRGELRIKTEEWAHLIVHASKVCMVGNVEALGCQLQFCLLANFMLPSQAHIEIGVVRAKSRVTAGSDRTFVGGVIVAVHLAACQQVERMSTVVTKNRSQLKAGKEGILPGTFNYAGRNEFLALIELRKLAIGAEVGLILRSKIAIKISSRVEAFAESVVAKQREVIAEALLDFYDSSLVKGGTRGSVLIVLDDKRIYEASEGSECIGRAGKAFRATERICTGTKVPVTVGDGLPVG